MEGHPWVQEFGAAVTVCDADGIILEMNDRSARMFKEQGGRALLGSNMLDCHPEPSRSKLRAFVAQREPNVYTVEKRGVKKLVYQTWWQRDGRDAGFLEVALEIPFDLPHFVRAG